MSGALWERFRDEHKRLRADFDDHLDAMYRAAEVDTNGVLLNRLGRRQGIDARSLFYGPFSRVEKYASEELYAWFAADDKRRMTWEQFEKWMVEMPPRFVLGTTTPASMDEMRQAMSGQIYVLPDDFQASRPLPRWGAPPGPVSSPSPPTT